MREELLHYYERELRFIRRMASEFAERYPAVAGQLLLEPDKCEDPHVERLIESFAMLTSRIRLRLDDEFPEITDSFLGMLYPHYLAPIPSTTIVELTLDPEWNREGAGLAVERGTLMHTRPVGGVRCRFRTCYPVTLWPIQTESVEIVPLRERESGSPVEARAAIRIRLRTLGGRPFSKVGADELVFFLDGEARVAHRLYEMLFRQPVGVLVRDPVEEETSAVVLSPDHVEPVGFGRDEGILPAAPGATLGHRILHEYFSFPDKFLFARVKGLRELADRQEGDRLDVLILLDEMPADLQGKLAPENFRLGCTPSVNLFSHQADPIQLRRNVVENQIVPDTHSPESYEVYAVEEVSGASARTGESREYRPFYDVRHGEGDPDAIPYWHAVRRPTARPDDPGSEIHLSLVDRSFHPVDPDTGEVLSVRVLCTNRDIPPRLPIGEASEDFRIEGKPGIRSVICRRKPTPVIRPPDREEGRWKLVSHLSLNFLSIAETASPGNGTPGASGESPSLHALREILRLYDFADSAVTRQRIAGLLSLESRPVLRRIPTPGAAVHARGLEVTLELDEDRYAGSGVFLFASILERFLGLYASVNSFVQTVVKVRQREGLLKTWPPRAGQRQLL